MSRPLRFGSVCSGIEAATVAWQPLGWQAAWLSEIERFPSALLAYRYPTVPNLGDMRGLPDKIAAGEIEAPDVFCGGTPCQSFSYAGKRGSLGDDRGNLTLIFCEIANAIDTVRRQQHDPESIIVWENVPGVLNTKDNAFGCFLGALAGETVPLKPSGKRWTNAGCVFGPQRAVAWRVLDAQYFGVAQRRRRVFVVASARAEVNPAEILFECEGVRRDTAPSRETGQAASCDARTGANGASHWDSPVMSHPTLCQSHNTGGIGASNQELFGQRGGGLVSNGIFRQQRSTDYTEDNMASTIAARDYKDATDLVVERTGPTAPSALSVSLRGREGGATAEVGGTVSGTIRASSGGGDKPHVLTAYPTNTQITTRHKALGERTGMGVGKSNAPAYTLTNGHCHAAFTGCLTPHDHQRQRVHGIGDVSPTLQSEQGRGHGVPTIFDETQQPTDDEAPIDVTAIHGTQDPIHSANCALPLSRNNGQENAVVFGIPGNWIGRKSENGGNATTPPFDRAPCLTKTDRHGVSHDMAIRRLTPVECERLQGFPDDYTRIPWRGKTASECPDGHRYKALGNSWAVPVVRWIGQRIAGAIGSR